MIDGESLIQRMLSSDTKADLLTLFRRNPGIIDDIDGVAHRIGRSPKSIRAEVDDLLDLGVLGRKQAGRTVVFFLQKEKDAELQEAITTYLLTPGAVSI
jgi:predicted transcriptional regulator